MEQEIKYGQLWARHSELVEADQVGKYRVTFEGLKKAVEEAMRIQQPNEQPVEQKENEAVMFAEWCVVNFMARLSGGKLEGWINMHDKQRWANSVIEATAQLYSEYQKQNQ